MGDNLAGMAGHILKAPEKLESLYGRKDLYRAYAEIERRSGVSDVVTLIFPAKALEKTADDSKAADETPAELLHVSANVLVIGATQTYRNAESGQIDTFIYCEYVCNGYAEPQNQVEFTGTVERAPKFRTTPKGKKITDLIIRVPSKFEKTFYCLVPVIAWGKTAEQAAKLAIGDAVEIAGRLQSREYVKRYDDSSEEVRTTTEVSAAKVEICEQ